MAMQHTFLSIAGFDGSGGAGLQADMKTASALGCYAMTVLTALPVQNTTGVRSKHVIPLDIIRDQLHAIFDDIPPKAIKIGMLFNTEIIALVADFLKKHAAGIPIVLDPVMVCKSKDRILLEDAITSLKEQMLPLATIITPNLPEAETLAGKAIPSRELMEPVATELLALGPKAVLLKGGHFEGSESPDLFLSAKKTFWLEGKRIQSHNTHGTGCTLSAAIAAGLSLGLSLEQACCMAKSYLYQAIAASAKQSVGKGHGPVHHFYHTWPVLDSLVLSLAALRA